MSIFSSRPQRIEPSAGQESVWDYPRPPRLEPVTARLRVVFGGVTIADTIRGFRVLETSHPPNYYFPPDDVLDGALECTAGASFCEWKGRAHYFTVYGGGLVAPGAAWGYTSPSAAFASIAHQVGFYVAPMDACFVDDERVVAQPGGFYGGWITSAVVGPFKGDPGTRGW
jgi:uncharacterized protein (DUF427 family)